MQIVDVRRFSSSFDLYNNFTSAKVGGALAPLALWLPRPCLTVKTAWSYLHSCGQNTGTWRTDRQTDRQKCDRYYSAGNADRTRCKNVWKRRVHARATTVLVIRHIVSIDISSISIYRIVSYWLGQYRSFSIYRQPIFTFLDSKAGNTNASSLVTTEIRSFNRLSLSGASLGYWFVMYDSLHMLCSTCH